MLDRVFLASSKALRSGVDKEGRGEGGTKYEMMMMN
jgi:hypothetical protein